MASLTRSLSLVSDSLTTFRLTICIYREVYIPFRSHTLRAPWEHLSICQTQPQFLQLLRWQWCPHSLAVPRELFLDVVDLQYKFKPTWFNLFWPSAGSSIYFGKHQRLTPFVLAMYCVWHARLDSLTTFQYRVVDLHVDIIIRRCL